MERDLTKGSVLKALMSFVLPFFGAYILQFLYGLVDVLIVGRFASTEALSAVHNSSQIMQLVLSIVAGVGTGGTVIIGRYVGSKDKAGVKKAVNAILWVFLLMAVIITLIFAIGTPAIIKAAQIPSEAVASSKAYLYICTVGIIFITGYNGIAGILRGLGDSKRPMYFVVVSCLVNIFGDFLFVGVFRLGAAGAASATVIAQLVSIILAVICLQKSEYKMSKTDLSFNKQEGKNLIKIGLPLGAQDFFANLSFVIITVVVNMMGVEKSAAVGVVERTVAFFGIAPIAFLSALSAFTAQNLGARLVDRAKKALHISLCICASIALIIVIIVEIIPSNVVSIFTSDPAVILNGSEYIRTYIIDTFLFAFVFCMNGFFAGCERTGFVMANVLISTFVVRVPIVVAVSFIPNVSLLYIGIAAPMASLVQIIMQYIYYKRMRFDQIEAPVGIVKEIENFVSDED